MNVHTGSKKQLILFSKSSISNHWNDMIKSSWIFILLINELYLNDLKYIWIRILENVLIFKLFNRFIKIFLVKTFRSLGFLVYNYVSIVSYYQLLSHEVFYFIIFDTILLGINMLWRQYRFWNLLLCLWANVFLY